LAQFFLYSVTFQRKVVEKIIGKGKGKAIPLQVWTGPEGSWRMRYPDFKTVNT